MKTPNLARGKGFQIPGSKFHVALRELRRTEKVPPLGIWNLEPGIRAYLPHGYAPWRRTTGGSCVASTRVEGLTPGVFPPSTSRSISRRNSDSTVMGEKGGCAPERLALVPVSGPTRESRSRDRKSTRLNSSHVRI